jgi:hypothetical protein
MSFNRGKKKIEMIICFIGVCGSRCKVCYIVVDYLFCNLALRCVRGYPYRFVCLLLFVNYGSTSFHVYYEDYLLNEFISYSDNVFLSKISLEDSADPGSLCTDQSVGNHCWYLGMAAVIPTL